MNKRVMVAGIVTAILIALGVLWAEVLRLHALLRFTLIYVMHVETRPRPSVLASSPCGIAVVSA